MASLIRRPLPARRLWTELSGTRFASTTPSSSLLSSGISPESPDFVYVPRSKQEAATSPQRVKGVLPVPRHVFDKRDGERPRQLQPQYLEQTAPEKRSPPNQAPDVRPEMQAAREYRARAAEIRRANLKGGLGALKKRDAMTAEAQRRASSAKRADFQRKVHMPEREDERLTTPSVLYDPPQRKARRHRSAEELREATARVEARRAQKEADRRHALHSLYVNARDFIVDEEDLARTVDEVFGDNFSQKNPDLGIWDREGTQETVRNMLAKDSPEAGGRGQVTRDRAQRLVEELTGGKM